MPGPARGGHAVNSGGKGKEGGGAERGVAVPLAGPASPPRPKRFLLPKGQLFQPGLTAAPSAHSLFREAVARRTPSSPRSGAPRGRPPPPGQGGGAGPDRGSLPRPRSLRLAAGRRVSARSRPHAVLCLDSADPGAVTLARSGGGGKPHSPGLEPPPRPPVSTKALRRRPRVALLGAACQPQWARGLRDRGTLRPLPSGSSQFRGGATRRATPAPPPVHPLALRAPRRLPALSSEWSQPPPRAPAPGDAEKRAQWLRRRETSNPDREA